jgi:UDP-glucose 4-epimerase
VKCLILGGAGFIGSHLAEGLVKRHHQVRVFGHVDADRANLAKILPNIELIRGEFLSEKEVSRALSGIDVAIHLVSTTVPKTSNDNPAYDVGTNVTGTLNMLALARQHGVKKVIFPSSGGTVYGSPTLFPIRETHPTDPICSHGVTKLTIEKYLHLFHHLYDLDYVVLRIANPYGARQNPRSNQGAVSVFLRKLLKGEPITIWGDGTIARDYLYIEDLVSAFLTVIETQTPSRLYNIGSGVPLTLTKLLDVMQTVTGRVPTVEYLASRKLDVSVNHLDIARARQELGWQPRISIQEGISRTWESLLHREVAIGD